MDSRSRRRRNRPCVARACVYCQRSHLSCEAKRPCRRCVDRGIAHLCRDGPRKDEQQQQAADASPALPQIPPPVSIKQEDLVNGSLPRAVPNALGASPQQEPLSSSSHDETLGFHAQLQHQQDQFHQALYGNTTANADASHQQLQQQLQQQHQQQLHQQQLHQQQLQQQQQQLKMETSVLVLQAEAQIRAAIAAPMQRSPVATITTHSLFGPSGHGLVLDAVHENENGLFTNDPSTAEDFKCESLRAVASVLLDNGLVHELAPLQRLDHQLHAYQSVMDATAAQIPQHAEDARQLLIRYSTSFGFLHLPTLLCSESGSIQFANSAASDLLAVTEGLAQNVHLYDLVEPGHIVETVRSHVDLLLNFRQSRGASVHARLLGGTDAVVTFSLVKTPVGLPATVICNLTPLPSVRTSSDRAPTDALVPLISV